MTRLVRRLAPGDAALLAALRREALETEPLAFSASVDDSKLSVEFVRGFVAPSDESAVFGAFSDDALVGMVGIRRHANAKERHKAEVWGMYVRAEHRGAGSGEKLLRAAIDRARSWPGVDQVQLSVGEKARSARRLYERLGFREWGVEPRALRWEGQEVDETHMVLELKPR